MKIEYPKPPEPDFMSEDTKYILDACCGSRMFWFDRQQKNTVYMDNREFEDTLCDGRRLIVKPDIVGDFRQIPFPDETFRLVVFDPPHLRHGGDKSWIVKKYGKLNPRLWKDDLRAGFNECFRVLIRCGVLVFKWNEQQIPLGQIVPLAPERPLFGQKSGRTHWLVYMKSLASVKQNEKKPNQEGGAPC